MDTGQFLIDFVGKNGISTAVLMFIAWFLTTRVWPWMTKEWWPAMNEREKARTNIQDGIMRALVKIEVIAQTTATTMVAHDTLLRQMATLLTQSNNRIDGLTQIAHPNILPMGEKDK